MTRRAGPDTSLAVKVNTNSRNTENMLMLEISKEFLHIVRRYIFKKRPLREAILTEVFRDSLS
jgi:hypothetical protein